MNREPRMGTLTGFLTDGPGQGTEKDARRIGDAWWAGSEVATAY